MFKFASCWAVGPSSEGAKVLGGIYYVPHTELDSENATRMEKWWGQLYPRGVYSPWALDTQEFAIVNTVESSWEIVKACLFLSLTHQQDTGI